MKIINRYLYKELITPFFFGVAAFTGIFIGTDLLFRLTEYHTRWGVDLFTLIKIFLLSLPGIVVVTFPMATLLANIMGFSRLSQDSEVTALRAGGVSIYRLVIPALVVGLAMSLLTIGINELVVPGANYRNQQLVYQFKYGRKLPKTQYNLYLTPLDRESGRPDYILYTHRFDGETGLMNDVLLQDYEQGKPTTLIEAARAKWLSDGWYFYDGIIYHLQAGERVPALSFKETKVSQIAQQPAQISRLNKTITDMSMTELGEYIALLKKQGKSASQELVKWHQRLSIPFASFIFALIAAPLGIQPRRSGGSAVGMGLSIIVIFIYYILMTIGDALGSQGSIAPWLGAWIQNIVFLVAGGLMLGKMGR